MNNRVNFGNMMSSLVNDPSTQYVFQIMLYSVLFFGLAVILYYFLRRESAVKLGNPKALMIVFVIVGFATRIVFGWVFTGHPYDIRIFENWAKTAANGLVQVYSNGQMSDYPPLYMYILWIIGKLTSVDALSNNMTIIIKLPSVLADMITSFLLFKLAKKYVSSDIAVLIAGFYLFNPAILINSTVWGQVDSFFTMLIVAAILLLSEDRVSLSTLVFAMAILMKPQGIIFAPVILFEFIRRKNILVFIRSVFVALLGVLIIALPFEIAYGPMWIINLYLKTVGEYPYASVNAFNFYSLLGLNYVNDSNIGFIFSYHLWGLIAIALITLFSGFIYLKSKNSKFASVTALMLITGVFNFSSRMHERYLFPAIALAIIAYIYLKDKRFIYLAGGFSLTVYANTHYVLYQTNLGVNSIELDLVNMSISALNVFLVIYLIKILVNLVFRKEPKSVNH